MNNNELKFNSIMSFIPRVQVMMMLKNKKEFTTVESSFSSLNFDQLEKSFILNLKFLSIDKQEFKKILENKKRSWRYNNEFLRYLSWYKYQANSLITFDNTNDFRSDELEFIKQSSPTKTQQIIIPQFEINRLLNLYDVLDINQDIENPDLIVLKRGSLVEKYSFIDLSVYCRSNNFDIFKIYYKKINDICDQ